MSSVGCLRSRPFPVGLWMPRTAVEDQCFSCSLTIASVLLSGNALTAWDQPFTLTGLTVFNFERSPESKEKSSEEVRTTLKIAVILGLFCSNSCFDAVTDYSHDRESSPSLHHTGSLLSQLTWFASFYASLRHVPPPQRLRGREYGYDTAVRLLLHQCQKLYLVMAKRSHVKMRRYYFGRK